MGEDHSAEVENMLLDAGYEGALYLQNPDYISAIVGVSHDNRVIYSYGDMVSYLMKEERMTEDEAEEWIDYNTIRAINYMPEDKAPIVMYEIYA